MRINRRFLYIGVFLVALGAVLVAADLKTLDLTVVRDALRLWPVAIVLIGIALVARRSPIAVPAGLVAATVPGLALGGALAIGPRFITDCGLDGDAVANRVVRQGAFDVPGTVAVHASCATIVVSTVPGTGWQLDAANSRGRLPEIAATATSLAIGNPGAEHWPAADIGRGTWQLALPASEIRELAFTGNATDGRMDLAGARIDGLDLTANASQLKVDLSTASVSDLSVVANFSAASITLSGLTDLTGELRANASQIRICAPADLGVRVSGRGFADNVELDGDDRLDLDRTFQSLNYATATHHADLRVTANFGNVEINPIGGCK